MRVIGIHQPGYLPWLGFFKKMINADIFVYFDDTCFVKNNYYHRNFILTNNGPFQLTIPVRMEKESKISDIKIDSTKNWNLKHKKTIIHSYSKAKHFKKYKDIIEKLYEKKFEKLIDINIEIIEFLKKEFNIKTKTVLASELDISNFSASERILEICKLLGADHYITGTVWAKKFLKIQNFKDNNIDVEFQEFVHPRYNQPYNDFVPNMASIDLLFNEGKINSEKILHNATTKNEIV